MQKIEIYTLGYCPFCQKAKMFFDEKNIKYTEIHCDDDEETKRKELTEKFKLPSLATFPQIVVDDINIGGYSDLIEKYNSKQIVFD